MGFFILVILFFAYIYYSNSKIENLQQENAKLKKQLSNLTKQENLELLNKTENQENLNQTIHNIQTISTRQTISNKEIISKSNSTIVDKCLTEEEKIEIQRNVERKEREKKNTTVLITGAILIVLAAIVFLMSTWETISNIIKTAVLVLLIGVFLGGSKIAKEKYKLEKTSNTFFYIAMAYIPICLISCSIFGLFGEYLSLYGEGKYTYLTISAVFVSIIYYINYRMQNSKILFYGSILSQLCSIILFGLIFGKNELLISTMLLIYNIALILLTKKENNIELLHYFYNGIPYSLGIYIGIISLSNITSSVYMISLIILLAINFLLLYKNKKSDLTNAYLFNITLYYLGFYLIFIHDFGIQISSNTKVIIAIIYFIMTLIFEAMLSRNDKNLNKSSMVINLISIALMYLELVDNKSVTIKPFIITGIECGLMLLMYIKSDQEGKNVLSYLIPITLLITIWHIQELFVTSYHSYIIVSLLVFVLGELIKGNEFKILKNGFFVVTNINLTLIFVSCVLIWNEKFLNDVIYFILLLFVYIYDFLKNKNYIIFKYCGYLTIGFVLLTSINFLQLPNDLKLLIPMLMSICYLLIENKYKFIKDEFSLSFNSIIEVIAYITLIEIGEVYGVLITLLYSSYLIYNNIKNNENKYLRTIPVIGFLITILEASLSDEYQILFMLITTTLLSFLSICQKKISIDTIFSGIYLICVLDCFNNEYIQGIFVLIWAIANMQGMVSEKSKDIFKIISYVAGLMIYNNILRDLNMAQMVSFEMIGITVFCIQILKNILPKYINNSDTLEYIIYSLLYLISIFKYSNEFDGIIFVLFVVGIVMYSYIKKDGILFIVSIFAILGNAILLTRGFWLAIPWWIYLLLVGSILIGFAMKNESDDRNEKINVGNVIKNLKDKIEK